MEINPNRWGQLFLVTFYAGPSSNAQTAANVCAESEFFTLHIHEWNNSQNRLCLARSVKPFLEPYISEEVHVRLWYRVDRVAPTGFDAEP